MTKLEDECIKLKAIEPEDLNLLYEIESNRNDWNTGTAGIPYSRFALRQYLEEQTSDIYQSRQLRLTIQNKLNSKPIGLVELYNFEPLSLKAEIGIAILKEEEHKGYAKRATDLLIEYAQQTLRIHQLYAYVALSNERSRKLFISLGFCNICNLKDWIYKDGRYEDVIFFQLLL